MSEFKSLINFHDNMCHNSTKIHGIWTWGPYSIGAQIYLTPAFKMKAIYNCIIDCIIHNLGKSILMICLRFHAKMKLGWSVGFLCPPLKKGGHIALHLSVGRLVGRSVGLYVGMSVSLNLVQLITQ